ncbi:MAG: DUF559 domain-containing protein [Micrococcales bacterium]|nr:DUF559 domain-containing protein [Micrococcales bacterium]
MPRIVRLPTELHGRAFTVREGSALGLGLGRMRGKDLESPFTGVRAAQPISTHLDRCRAYAARMPANQFFSHASAARIHGIPIPWRLDRGPIHVCTFDADDGPRARGVVGHTVQEQRVNVTTVDGLRVVSAVDAWCELAMRLTINELIVAGDRLRARTAPLCSLSDMQGSVRAFAGRRGVRKLRVALEGVRAGVDSPKESELRLKIVSAGLPEPAVNVPIFNRLGAQIAIGDLVYEKYRVLVEYDGEQHRLDDKQYARDVERLADLASENWTIVRILKGQLVDAVPRVRFALCDAGWRQW